MLATVAGTKEAFELSFLNILYEKKGVHMHNSKSPAHSIGWDVAIERLDENKYKFSIYTYAFYPLKDWLKCLPDINSLTESLTLKESIAYRISTYYYDHLCSFIYEDKSTKAHNVSSLPFEIEEKPIYPYLGSTTNIKILNTILEIFNLNLELPDSQLTL